MGINGPEGAEKQISKASETLADRIKEAIPDTTAAKQILGAGKETAIELIGKAQRFAYDTIRKASDPVKEAFIQRTKKFKPQYDKFNDWFFHLVTK